MSVTADARELHSQITRLRHELHQEPEIGLALPRTQEKVLKALDGLPYEITLGETTTSGFRRRTCRATKGSRMLVGALTSSHGRAGRLSSCR